MSEATLLESRLSKVERDNRRLKLALGALLLALAAVPLIGAVMLQEIPGMALGSFLVLVAVVPLASAMWSGGGRVPEVIEAREFRVIDENGSERATMNDTGFYYRDENGTIRISMDAGCYDSPGVGCYDKNGTLSVLMGSAGVFVADEDDSLRPVAYGLTVDGTLSVLIQTVGIVFINAEGIRYEDWNGNVVWRTPER